MLVESSRNVSINDLLNCKLFNGEEPDVIAWLIDLCEITHLQENEILLNPAENNKNLYIVLSGRLRVQLQADDDMPVLDFIETYDCVGEMSILEDTITSAAIIADTECTVFAIKDIFLWSLINRSHTVSRNLLKTLCGRVRNEHVVIKENFRLQQTFKKQSRVDSLTGLYNRRWLDDTLAERCTNSYTYKNNSLSVMMLDIDNFKNYNDTLGHLAGDRVIHSVADTIATQLRPTDHAARYGGEEFVALLPDASCEEARVIAERVCDAIREQKMKYNNGDPLPGVTISIGVAELESGQNKEALLAAADAALYRAKNAGRDQVSN